jgi:hypothetical protein
LKQKEDSILQDIKLPNSCMLYNNDLINDNNNNNNNNTITVNSNININTNVNTNSNSSIMSSIDKRDEALSYQSLFANNNM